MDRLAAMSILVTAVETGSLSAASRRLRIPLATVSRRVVELEEHLKVRLLHRGNRKVTLTDAGLNYVTSCRQVLEQIAEIERTAIGEYRSPQGELTVSMSIGLGRTFVLPIVAEFMRTFPNVRVRALMSDRSVNLLEEHVDVAVRVGELADSSMIATRAGLARQVICASPAYLKVRGTPKEPDDLKSHDCIVYDSFWVAGGRWEFHVGKRPQMFEVPHRLVVNSGEAAVVAAAAGAGIARVLSYAPDALVKPNALVKLLESYEPSPMPVTVIYPDQRQVPLKLRAFLDFAMPRLRKKLGSEDERVVLS